MQRAAVSLNRYPDLMGRDLVTKLSAQTGGRRRESAGVGEGKARLGRRPIDGA